MNSLSESGYPHATPHQERNAHSSLLEKDRTHLGRVVVTGLGLVTSLGNDLASSWEALCQGKSGISEITGYDTSRHRVHFGGEIRNFDPIPYMDRKEVRRNDPYE